MNWKVTQIRARVKKRNRNTRGRLHICNRLGRRGKACKYKSTFMRVHIKVFYVQRVYMGVLVTWIYPFNRIDYFAWHVSLFWSHVNVFVFQICLYLCSLQCRCGMGWESVIISPFLAAPSINAFSSPINRVWACENEQLSSSSLMTLMMTLVRRRWQGCQVSLSSPRVVAMKGKGNQPWPPTPRRAILLYTFYLPVHFLSSIQCRSSKELNHFPP